MNLSAFSATREIILAMRIASLFTHIWLYFKSCFLSSNEVCGTNAINFLSSVFLKKKKKKFFSVNSGACSSSIELYD